jgi:membrane associated rhomboid family serine protease
MRRLNAVLFVSVFLFTSHLSGSLQAYLDPGTGSIVLQLVLGGIVGAVAVLKTYWRRLKAFTQERRDPDDTSMAE